MTLFLLVLTLALAAVAAAGVLVAVWAGQSHRHWFVRAFAVWLFIAATLPVRAYEPALVFALSLPLIALIVRAAESFKKRTTVFSDIDELPRFTWRFTLRDSLLAIAIFSLFLGIAVEVPRAIHQQPDWIGTKYPGDILMPAAAVALVGLLAWYAVWGKFRIVAFIGLIIATTGCPWFMSSRCQWFYVWGNDITELGMNSLLPSSDRERLRLVITTLGLGEFAAILSVVALLSNAAARSSAICRARSVLLAALAIGSGVLYLQMLRPASFPPSISVSPNHFDRTMQIAQRVKEINEGSIAAEDVEEDDPTLASELRDLCDELVWLLAVPSAKSLDLSSKAERQARERMDTEAFGLGRILSRWLNSEARAARIRGDLPTAADFVIANLQFGAAFRTNGLLIDDLIARAMLNYSYREQYAARQNFDPPTIQRIVVALNKVDLTAEPIDRIVQRDLAYCEREYGWQGCFGDPLARLTQGNNPLHWKDYSQYPTAADIYRTIIRLLEIDLAIRAFQQLHGQLPASLNMIVPEFLPEEPVDPFTGRSFIYRTESDGDFTLYGVGSDGVDNGGKFTFLAAHNDGITSKSNRGHGYDLDLETLVRPYQFR